MEHLFRITADKYQVQPELSGVSSNYIICFRIHKLPERVLVAVKLVTVKLVAVKSVKLRN
jgi:hypothetical protein